VKTARTITGGSRRGQRELALKDPGKDAPVESMPASATNQGLCYKQGLAGVAVPRLLHTLAFAPLLLLWARLPHGSWHRQDPWGASPHAAEVRVSMSASANVNVIMRASLGGVLM
jgi:hypothetical protein